MVVFVDLEGDEDELQDIQQSLSQHALTSQQRLQKLRIRDGQSEYPSVNDKASNDQLTQLPHITDQSNPNINGFSAALSCYPYIPLDVTVLRVQSANQVPYLQRGQIPFMPPRPQRFAFPVSYMPPISFEPAPEPSSAP